MSFRKNENILVYPFRKPSLQMPTPQIRRTYLNWGLFQAPSVSVNANLKSLTYVDFSLPDISIIYKETHESKKAGSQGILWLPLRDHFHPACYCWLLKNTVSFQGRYLCHYGISPAPSREPGIKEAFTKYLQKKNGNETPTLPSWEECITHGTSTLFRVASPSPSWLVLNQAGFCWFELVLLTCLFSPL